jgi:hypothetical protein
MNNVVEFVKLMLRDKQVDPTVLENVPVYVRRAVVKLQRRNLFPTKQQFLNTELEKREQRRLNGDLFYNYLRLPQDFREMVSWSLEDEVNYRWIDDEENLNRSYNANTGPRYTIRQFSDTENGIEETRLILFPYPEREQTLLLEYWIDGTDVSINKIPEKYWEAILTVIMVDLMLISSFDADGEINDTAHQQQNTQGKKLRITTKPSFFTKSGGYKSRSF